MKKLFIFFAVAFLFGCASKSSIVVGKTRPAIAPEQVRLYLRPPKKYEEVAILESSSRNSWAASDQGKMDVVIERLKEEAAKIGANGVLIQGTGTQSSGAVSTGTGQATLSGNTAYGSSVGFSGNIFHKTGAGIAIFVEEE